MWHTAHVVVIGGGQAGRAAGYHLRRLGVDFVIRDAQSEPGGAWQHAWNSRIAVGDLGGGDPAEHRSALVESDEAVLGQLRGVERLPGRRGRLEGGVALDDARLVDRQDSSAWEADIGATVTLDVVLGPDTVAYPLVPAAVRPRPVRW